MNISQELKGLIPPLSESEKAQLEANCKADGIRDALIIARYPNEDGEAVEVLADGHNRYEIAEDNNLPYKTEVKEFDSLSDVKIWMFFHQLGRRNLTDGWKWELSQGIREELLEKGKEKYKKTLKQNNNPNTALSLNDKADTHNTQTKVAETLNWSKGKTAQAEQVWKKAPEEVKQAVRDGDMTIGGAYKEVKKAENTEKRKDRDAEEVKLSNQTPIVFDKDCLDAINDVGEIDLLLTDPPYFTDGNFINHISQYLKKVKPTGQAYVFAGADPEEIKAYLSIDSGHMQLVQMIVWNYNNTGQRQPNVKYTSNYQVAFYFRGPDADNINKPADGKEQYACQTINAPDARQNDRFHKWQKPDELIRRLVMNSSKEGDFVFDPFAGSGTHLVIAAKLGRKAEGCEIDQEAIKICIQRGCKNG
jgi:DNA modification methylase